MYFLAMMTWMFIGAGYGVWGYRALVRRLIIRASRSPHDKGAERAYRIVTRILR